MISLMYVCAYKWRQRNHRQATATTTAAEYFHENPVKYLNLFKYLGTTAI